MKVNSTLREAYARQLELCRLIRDEVEALRVRLDPKWHYEERIKSEEGFAQKIEAGIGNSQLDIDDFFACTIVVRNYSEIRSAVRTVEENFIVRYRRPQDADKTKTRPTDFLFDDLRLYVNLKPSYIGHRPIDNVIFEVQVKTFLQHAWGIATHDLTYKTDSVRWAKVRLAYQIRAMLEHAEVSISQFSQLSTSEVISKDFEDFRQIDDIIICFRELWEPSSLPKDMQRLAQTLKNACITLQLNTNEALLCIKAATDEGGGAKLLDLSPFSAAMQAILEKGTIMASQISSRRSKKIYLPSEVVIPESMNSLVGNVIIVY